MVHNDPSAMCGVALKTAKRHVWKRLDYPASANDDGGIFSLTGANQYEHPRLHEKFHEG
jgi:hypothetical protein